MSATEKARIEMVKLIGNGLLTNSSKIINDAVNQIGEKYDDINFAVQILQSMDNKHLNLINISIGIDPVHQNRYTSSLNSAAHKYILTPDGKEILKELDK